MSAKRSYKRPNKVNRTNKVIKLGRLAEQNKVTYYIVVLMAENTIKSPKSNKNIKIELTNPL